MQRHHLAGVVLACALILAVLLLLPVLHALVAILPIALLVLAIVSCIGSNKPTNTKLLWIIVIILAPILGPLLWFFWGKRQAG
jgi:membrane protein DedA with SNARE-associated domain